MPSSPFIAHQLKPLVDLTPENLAYAGEANFAEEAICRTRAVGGEIHFDADAIWMLSKPDVGGNSLCFPRFQADNIEARLDEILNCYFQAEERLNFMLGAGYQPEDLERRLRARGLNCYSRVASMFCQLDNLKLKVKQHPKLRIKVIEDFSLFEQYAHPAIGPLTTPRRRDRLECLKKMCALEPRQVWNLVGFLNDEPVASCYICLGGGVAGLYGVEVIKQARRQGFGSATTLAACKFAHEQGYHAAVLFPSGQGKLFYPHIGFEYVGTFSHWEYSKTTQRKQSQTR